MQSNEGILKGHVLVGHQSEVLKYHVGDLEFLPVLKPGESPLNTAQLKVRAATLDAYDGLGAAQQVLQALLYHDELPEEIYGNTIVFPSVRLMNEQSKFVMPGLYFTPNRTKVIPIYYAETEMPFFRGDIWIARAKQGAKSLPQTKGPLPTLDELLDLYLPLGKITDPIDLARVLEYAKVQTFPSAEHMKKEREFSDGHEGHYVIVRDRDPQLTAGGLEYLLLRNDQTRDTYSHQAMVQRAVVVGGNFTLADCLELLWANKERLPSWKFDNKQLLFPGTLMVNTTNGEFIVIALYYYGDMGPRLKFRSTSLPYGQRGEALLIKSSTK